MDAQTEAAPVEVDRPAPRIEELEEEWAALSCGTCCISDFD